MVKRSAKGINNKKISKILWLAMVFFCLIGQFGVAGAKAHGEACRNGEVYVGGMPFGVKFTTEGVTVVGFCNIGDGNKKNSPAESAGIRIRDVVVGINGEKITTAEELTTAVENSGGKKMTFEILRNGERLEIELLPSLTSGEDKYKAGIWVKDNGAGIGTVTFINDDGIFGGLGHGICDSESGELIPMNMGVITDVTVSGIVRGVSGTPGEIKGYFASGKKGNLLGNTECGVFGIFADKDVSNLKVAKIGMKEELHEGDATLICTLDDNKPHEYSVKITGISIKETGNKCFCIQITDQSLIEKTGGIVQGMSGSPIIQDGKLVGAVTHVLINDPTMGYGIFIENMLNAAEMPQAKAS